MKLKIGISGASGWVGRPLCVAISKTDDLELVAAVARSHAGRLLAEITGHPGHGLMVAGSVEQALPETGACDVWVDFTSASAVKANVMSAMVRGAHVVIGSSGLTEEDFEEIDRAALRAGVGVIAAGNFAITVVLLQRFACEAAKYLSHWEIIDYATDEKVDAPSGTARELAFRLSQVAQPRNRVPLADTVGMRESRGATLKGSQIHSVRLPGHVLGIEALFGSAEERLSIRHDAGSGAAPYIDGTLLAIRRVVTRVGLVRGLDRIMD